MLIKSNSVRKLAEISRKLKTNYREKIPYETNTQRGENVWKIKEKVAGETEETFIKLNLVCKITGKIVRVNTI